MRGPELCFELHRPGCFACAGMLNVGSGGWARSWGLCKDEFEASDHWPPALYIREARRMQGAKLFTQNTPAAQVCPTRRDDQPCPIYRHAISLVAPNTPDAQVMRLAQLYLQPTILPHVFLYISRSLSPPPPLCCPSPCCC